MSLSEFELIRHYFAQSGASFARDEILLGIGDDGAALRLPPGQCLVMTMDVLVEGVHFAATAAPECVAHRALAANLSDLAAMAAEPLCFTLGLTMPAADETWLAGFSECLAKLAQRFNCPLVGGDVTRGPLSIAIQAQGVTRENALLKRSGARAGDRILVSGSLGDGAIGLASLGIDSNVCKSADLDLQALTADAQAYLHDAYCHPEPRITLGREAAALASSGIDISDGLAGDLGHIIRASGVGARVNLPALPFSAAARQCADVDTCRRAALFGGDDYELCLTAPESALSALSEKAQQLGLALTCIGHIVAGNDMEFLDARGEQVHWTQQAYQHFQEFQGRVQGRVQG